MAGYKGNSKVKSKEIKNKSNKNNAQNSEDAEELDFSILRRPVPTSVTGFAQAKKIFDSATAEVKELLCNECNMIYECRVCRNLFRSLANFISHKRIYCVEKFSIYTNFPDPTSSSCELLKIKRFEKKYQDFLKEGVPTQSSTTDEDDNRVPLTKDLTTLVEKIIKNKGLENNKLDDQDVTLQQIPQSSVAVYQTSQLVCNEDNMHSQVTELHAILSKENAVMQIDGKFKIQNKEEIENVIQISDDEDCSLKAELKCNECDQQFATRKTLKCHAKTKHLESRLVYPCPDCLETFGSTWSVFRHLFKVHRRSAAHVRRMREAIQAKAFYINNPPPSYEKRKANAKPATPVQITDEERLEQENQAWMSNMEADGEVPRCGGCGRTFERRAALNAHMNTCQTRSKALARRADPKKIEIQIHKNDATPAAKTLQHKEVPTCIENTLTEAIMSIVGVTASDEGEVLEAERPNINADGVKPIHNLPLSHQAENRNFNALKQRVMQDIVLEELTCKMCDSKFKEFNELYDHVAGHYKWVRYACKLCSFKHYVYEKVSDHIKVVHKMKADAEYLCSTIKAIDGAEATAIAEPKNESETSLPSKRRPSRSSSESNKLSDDISSISVARAEVGRRKRKSTPSRTAIKKKKDITNDEGDSNSKDSEPSPQKDILQTENDSSNSMCFSENSSDFDDSEDRTGKRLKMDLQPSGISRRPVRKRTVPKNSDFEYDLSNLLKKDGYKETPTNSNTKVTKKKTQQDIISNYNDLNLECKGSLSALSMQSVGESKAEIGKTDFVTSSATKDQKISNIFVRPMLPKITRSEKISPVKDPTLDNEKETPNKKMKVIKSKPAEVCNNDLEKQISESEALSNSHTKNIGNEEQIQDEVSKKQSACPQEKSKSTLNLVPIKVHKNKLDFIKNPLMTNMTDFSKAGINRKILLIKHISKSDSVASIKSPLKIQRIKINDANTSLKKDDKKKDHLLAANGPKTDTVVPSNVVCNSNNTLNEENNDEGNEIEKGNEVEVSKTINDAIIDNYTQETCLTQNTQQEKDTTAVAVTN